jgi:hypothetical protein
MKKKLFLPILYIAIILAIVPSCKRKGCTDSASTNFCSKCNTDDGSCQYQGNVVIWWNQATAQSWLNTYVATKVDVTIDGIFIGTYSIPGTYWSSAPTCGASGSINYSKSLGTEKTALGNVIIKTHLTGLSIVPSNTGSFTYTGGVCFQLQIQ